MAPNDCIRVATYNLHRCYGTDGRYDPERNLRVMKALDADVIGLQEVDTSLLPVQGFHQLDYFVKETGWSAIEGLVLQRRLGDYGNALLTPHKILEARRINLSIRWAAEPRGAIDADIEIRGRKVRVVVAHLGLQIWERHFQIQRLLRALGDDRDTPMVIMGDFNIWISLLPKLRRFYHRLGHAPLIRTFPAYFPVFSLDRVWAQPAAALRSVQAVITPDTKVASDHLPLIAEVGFPAVSTPLTPVAQKA
jgi:endonuclease/exonuclease/phosphatase family metal-dependent hydrolase